MDYTAIGDTVNVAARLTSQAGPGQIVISTATYAQICRQIPCSQLPAMKLKGRDEPIEVHEVLWREPLPQDRAAKDFKPTLTGFD
jgi:adenylate cyclase